MSNESEADPLLLYYDVVNKNGNTHSLSRLILVIRILILVCGFYNIFHRKLEDHSFSLETLSGNILLHYNTSKCNSPYFYLRLFDKTVHAPKLKIKAPGTLIADISKLPSGRYETEVLQFYCNFYIKNLGNESLLKNFAHGLVKHIDHISEQNDTKNLG